MSAQALNGANSANQTFRRRLGAPDGKTNTALGPCRDIVLGLPFWLIRKLMLLVT